jgi:predicted ATP-dependent Lon-type protease
MKEQYRIIAELYGEGSSNHASPGEVDGDEKLLVGGIWCIVTLEYFFEEEEMVLPLVVEK